MADTGCIGLVTGQIIGRWGNFVNCEAFGGYTDSLFAMRIKRSIVNETMISQDLLDHLILENGVEYIQVHPTFLYESAWNLGLCCLYSGIGGGKVYWGDFVDLPGRIRDRTCMDRGAQDRPASDPRHLSCSFTAPLSGGSGSFPLYALAGTPEGRTGK